jgi:purine-binding chemotaxis protein CheW
MLVDGVSEVYSVDTDEVQPTPDFGSNVDTRFIKGLATMDERLLILLEIDDLLNETVDIEVAEKTENDQAGVA